VPSTSIDITVEVVRSVAAARCALVGDRTEPDRSEMEPMDHEQCLTLTVTQAAERLSISRAFAYELIARGELPYLRLGRRVVVPRAALEALVDGASTAAPV
jgi:excisionase family DNA binding protein